MPDDDLEAIREGVRRVCSKFDDAYWRSHDADHEFPWDFYNLMAEGGWVGIAIPEEWGGGGRGITEALDRARGGRRIGRGDERLQRAAPLDLRDEPRREARQPTRCERSTSRELRRVSCMSRSA